MSPTLLLHWELDAVADGVLTDVSGAGRGGVVDGTAAAAPDARFGSCLTPGTGTVLRTGAADAALRGRTTTYAVWADLRRPAAGRTAVVGGRAGGPTLAVTAGGAVALLLPDTRITSADGVLDFAGWHHLAVTDDGTLLRAFVDGAQVAQGTHAAAADPGPGGLVLGAHAGGPGGSLVLDLTTTAKAGWTTTAMGAAGAAVAPTQQWWLATDGCLQNGADATRILDVMNGAYALNAVVIAWGRNKPAPSDNQRWTLDQDGHLLSRGNPLYTLDAQGGPSTPGGRAALWTINVPTSGNQVWARDADGRLRSQVSAANGRYAHLRFYDGALAPDALLAVMADDQSALAAFVRSHPLAVELTNPFGQPVLYIDDGAATQRLTLRATNTTRWDLELRPLPGPVSADCHHLALCLRPGTLAAAAVPTLAAPGWTLAAAPDGTALYLGATAATTLARGTWVDLPIGGLNADGAGGTRGTRVEVRVAHAGYVGETQEITGSRLVFLDVVNHRGRPDIPLHAAFIDGNRVLSDGRTAGRLRIRLSTVSRDVGVALAGAAAAGAAASRLVVSFEGKERTETREWALTDSGRAGEVTLGSTGPGATAWRTTSDDLGQRRSWTLTPTADTTLAPGTSVDLTLDSIYAQALPGQATVVVAYQNIPGYQDGFLTLVVERSPLLFGPTAVGIGAPAGSSPLSVTADSQHVQLRRPPTDGPGTRIFLDLVQSALPAGATTYPNIRMCQESTSGSVGFGARIEARRGGLLFLDWRLDATQYTDVTAGTGYLDRLRVGGTPTGLAIGARAHVVADSEHLQLRRPANASGTGSQIYLELFQDLPARGDTYPAIRFHHPDRFWNRIEGRPEGISFRDGNPASNAFVDIFACSVSAAATVSADRLQVGGTPTGNELTGRATVRGDSAHLQLRRESSAAGTGPQLYLELFQDVTPDGQVTNPCIRFHHSGKYWNRIEGVADGFAFRWGPMEKSDLVDVFARTAVVNNLRIGNVTVGENELRVLQLLAAGALKFDLRNTAQNEYAYAGNYKYDNDRRYVLTWSSHQPVGNGEWQLENPR